MKNPFAYLNPSNWNWNWNDSDVKQISSVSCTTPQTLDTSTPTKHLIIFPGGYYLCGTRSWSQTHLNWEYHFPGQNTEYLVCSPFLRRDPFWRHKPFVKKDEALDIYYNFCPGNHWQVCPEVLADVCTRLTGPIIFTKCGRDSDTATAPATATDSGVWTKQEILSLVGL